MATGPLGQMITFATEVDPDEKYATFVWIRTTRKGETIRHVAAHRGHPELAHEIARLNGIRSVTQKLRKGRLLKLPGTLEQKLNFTVYAGDNRPIIKDGYATFSVEQRPGRTGISKFEGYNPVVMDIAFRFDNWRGQDGTLIEDKIRVLERMAGRGPYKGAGAGPPAVIRVSCTDDRGNVVPLIPITYQWSAANKTAPLWRINGIDWDDGALSDKFGRRVRVTGTIHLWQYTPVSLATRSQPLPPGPKPIRVRSQPVTVHR